MQIKTTRRRDHFIPTRMVIKKTEDNKCCQWCGELGSLIHSWWGCKMVQRLWISVWQFLIELPYDPAILFLLKRNWNIFPQNMYSNVHNSKMWKQPKRSWTDQWINKWSISICRVLWTTGGLCNNSKVTSQSDLIITFLTGKVMVGSHASHLWNIYLSLKQALSIVLVHLGWHIFEMSD